MSWSPTRRLFLQASGFACLGSISCAASDKPNLTFPKQPRDRLAVTSYPFRAYIESPTNPGRKPELPGMDMTAFAGMIAEKFGVFNINPLGDHFRSTEPAYLASFRSSLEKTKSHIVDLGLGGREFYSADESTRNAAVEFGRKWIGIAAEIGSPSVRQHVHGKRTAKPDVELAAQSLGKLAEYGSQRNIVVNLENDSAVSEDPFFLVRVIEKVNSPYLRALPDFGNSLLGHDPEFNKRAVQAMLAHAYNMCHVKEDMEADGKQYRVDLATMFRLAKASRYPGYFSMECESQVEDPFTGTKRLIEQTLKYLT